MSNATVSPPALSAAYTVWLNGRTLTGSARAVIGQIKRHARHGSAVKRMSAREYVKSVVENASLFFPGGGVPEYLVARSYPDDYVRALEYLAAMPSSGMRILTRRSGKG